MSNHTVSAAAEGMTNGRRSHAAENSAGNAGDPLNNRPFPAFDGYEKAFASLEQVIDRACRFARLQAKLAELRSELGTDDEATDCMALVAEETLAATAAVENLWLHFHNAGADASFRMARRPLGTGI